jgi:hypothetical protein
MLNVACRGINGSLPNAQLIYKDGRAIRHYHRLKKAMNSEE